LYAGRFGAGIEKIFLIDRIIPSMTNAATKSEYTTSAVPMAVGGTFRSSETGPIDTGNALMLKPI
jgi:hypothetical protein